MRVVSQNGDIDVPYEITAFHICHGRIRMNMAGDTGRGTEMAVYESQEKALKWNTCAMHIRISLQMITAPQFSNSLLIMRCAYEINLYSIIL